MGDSPVEQDDIAYYLTNIKVKKRYEDLLTNNFIDKPDENGAECKKSKGEIKGGGPGALTLEVMQKAVNKLTAKPHALADNAWDAAKDAELLAAKQYYYQKEHQALQNLKYAKGKQWNPTPPMTGQGQVITDTTSGTSVIYNNPPAAWTTAYDQWAGNSGLGAAGVGQPVPSTADPIPTPPKPAPESMADLYKDSCFDPKSERHLKFDGQVLMLGKEVEAEKSKTKAKGWAETIAKTKQNIMNSLNMPSGLKAGTTTVEASPIKATQYYTNYKPTSLYNWGGCPCTEAAYNYLSNVGDIAKLYNRDGVMMTHDEYFYE